MSKRCSLHVFDGRKVLHGTAAQLHKISIKGGWDAYHENLIEKITRRVTKEVLNELNRPVLKRVR